MPTTILTDDGLAAYVVLIIKNRTTTRARPPIPFALKEGLLRVVIRHRRFLRHSIDENDQTHRASLPNLM